MWPARSGVEGEPFGAAEIFEGLGTFKPQARDGTKAIFLNRFLRVRGRAKKWVSARAKPPCGSLAG